MFVSIHIPKTAGTALAKVFDDTSFRKIMYDYGQERDILAARPCPEDIKANRDFIESYFKYLHGHFYFQKYAQVFPNARYIATVRDPVERVISQYLHIRRSGDQKAKLHQLIMDGEMSVAEFSKREDIGNAQWHYLEGRPIKDYDFVFVQGRLDESLKKFSVRFGMPEIIEYLGWTGGVLPEVNQKPRPPASKWSFFRSPKAEFSPAEKRDIARNCERDLEIYRQALECLAAR